MADARIARLQTIFEEAGRPGARRFRTAARRRGENLTSAEAREFVSQQSTAQVFQARIPSDGVVSASRPDIRMMIDLIDYSKRKNENEIKPYYYCHSSVK